MANNFDLGETVICTIEVKNAAGTKVDPGDSMVIYILYLGTAIIDGVGMTDDTGDGNYHYDFDSDGQSTGKYVVRYKATDGTRVTIEEDEFDLN